MPGDTYRGTVRFTLVVRDTEEAAQADIELVEAILRQNAPELLGVVVSRPVPGGAACKLRTP